MITIVCGHSRSCVDLGETVEFEIRSRDPTVEIRTFLTHEGVSFLKPLDDWSASTRISAFPESPGRYTLEVQWRNRDGLTGWERRDFLVSSGDSANGTAPYLAGRDRVRLWTPSQWEAGPLIHAEEELLRVIADEVGTGSVAYDIGANVGLYSTAFSQLVGAEGHVLAIEANPVCVYFLRANLAMTGSANYTILPVALSSGDGTVRFTINYGNSSLGATTDSGYYGSKLGHEITVDTVALDDLIERRDLARPDFVKIDIEGAEVFALQGMRRTLTTIQPTLLLELHGAGLGVESLRIAQAAGYRTEEATTGHVFASPRAAVTRLGDGIWHVLCRPPRTC